jgi:hypothetical protein
VYVTDRASLTVARTIRLPLPLATAAAAGLRSGNDPVRAIRLPAGGRIQLGLPLRRDLWHPLGRPDLAPARGIGALYGRANRRLCPVEVELSPWSADVTELALRPAVRSPYGWGNRKLGRWFAQAHDAADTLRTEILSRSVAHAEVDEPEAVAV